MEQSPQYVIEMLHITKEFPGIKANDDITLQLRKGEIHALLGENGAGKSTLMSVLFGLYQPEEGEIRKNGQTVKKGDPMLKLDLDYLKANAPSVASPVLCTELEDNQKIRLLNEGEIKAGDELFAIDIYEA